MKTNNTRTFTVSSAVSDLFPQIEFGVIRGEIIAPRTSIAEVLSELQHDAMTRLEHLVPGAITDHPHVSGWRTIYKTFGVKPSKYKPTHEAFARRLLKGSAFPTINPITDIYLANQAAQLLPHGGYDLESVQGNLLLDVSSGDEPFEPLGGGLEHTNSGEIVYRDALQVLTRRWNYRDCDATCIRADTKSFIIMIENPMVCSTAELERATYELVDRYRKCFEGDFDGQIITSSQEYAL